MTMMRYSAPAALAAALLLTGCISFGAKPPEALLTLTPATAVPVGAAQSASSGRTLLIEVPTTPATLAGTRVPVQATPTTIAYVKEAQWSEPPARLFARLLSDTVTARSGRVVVSGVQPVDDPGATIAGELRNFGVDAVGRTAVVTFDAALGRGGQAPIEKRRFEARVPVAAIDGPSVGIALNDAANQVAGEVADWIGR